MKNIAYLYLFLAQFFVAFNIIINKLSALGAHPFTFSTIRYFMSFSVQLALHLLYSWYKKRPLLPSIISTKPASRSDFQFMVAQSLTGGMLFSLLFYSGLAYTSAVAASIISSSFPAVLTIMGYFFLKEKIDLNKTFAIFLSMAGIIILTLDTWEGSKNQTLSPFAMIGNLLVFLSMIPEALYSILARKIRGDYPFFETSLLVVFCCFLFMLPFGLFELFTTPNLLNEISWKDLKLLFWAGQTSTLFFIFWPLGVVRVSANLAGLFGAIVPVAATILAYFILHEHISAYDFLGMALVLLAIYLGAQKSKK